MPFKKGEENPMWGKKHTEEWKQKMSEIQKGKPKSPETIQRMKEAHKNDKGRPKGYKHTKEARENMSKGRKGMKFSAEHCRHLSEAHKGQVVTEEMRKNRSNYNKAHPENFEGLRMNRVNNPTVQQMALYKMIESLYPDDHIEFEWKVGTTDGIKFIDVAIPTKKLGWEFNHPFWHRDNEKDNHRKEVIEALGWKITQYSNTSDFLKK